MLDAQTVFWHETLSLILGHVALGLLGVLSVIVTAGICKPSVARFVSNGPIIAACIGVNRSRVARDGAVGDGGLLQKPV